MHRVIGHIGILLLVTLSAAAVSAETSLTGEIGVDLKNLSYKTSLSDTALAYSINRSQSDHYLKLLMSGALVNSHFANYSTNLRLSGAYFNSSNDAETRTEYIEPGFRGFYGQVTLLPEKPYPFQVYRSDARLFSLRYEPSNRSDNERLQPELSIVRRYRHDRNSSGAVWQLTPSADVKLLTEYKQENSQASRIYDFGENGDIWVTFIKSPARLGDTVFTVLFDSGLPDTADIEVVNLDSINVNPGFPVLRITDLPPDHTRMVYLFPGRTEIQIASTGLNSYFNIIEVDSNLVIGLKYRDPAAPNDFDQERRAFTGKLTLGSDDRGLRNDLFYEYSDQRESVKDQLTYLHNISNTARYKVSNELNADMLTNIQQNRNRIDTTQVQWNRVLTHSTNLNYLKRKSLSGSVSHMYTNSASHNFNPSLRASDSLSYIENDTLRSTMNSFSGRLTYPSRRWDHRVSIRTNMNLLSDNSGFVNNQYVGELLNSMVLMKLGFEWQPRHNIRYTITSQETPLQNSEENEKTESLRQNSKEIENRFGLTGEKSTALFGDLKINGEYTYRNRWDEVGSDTKSRYKADFLAIRKLKNDYRISLLANQEWEVSGGTAPTIGSGSASKSKTIYKSSYKIDVSAVLHKNFILGADIMIIKQGENLITKYGLSLNAIVPFIKIPVKSVILAESRKLAGQEEQTQLSIETKVSHRIRKISLTLQHVYQKEKLVFETYHASEIQGKISRQFGVL